jgi:hypothetical protein
LGKRATSAGSEDTEFAVTSCTSTQFLILFAFSSINGFGADVEANPLKNSFRGTVRSIERAHIALPREMGMSRMWRVSTSLASEHDVPPAALNTLNDYFPVYVLSINTRDEAAERTANLGADLGGLTHNGST